MRGRSGAGAGRCEQSRRNKREPTQEDGARRLRSKALAQGAFVCNKGRAPVRALELLKQHYPGTPPTFFLPLLQATALDFMMR